MQELGEVVSVDLIRALNRSDDRPSDWTLDDAEKARSRYIKFLLLAAKNKGHRIAPTKDIDVMWHLHMLHPRAYVADCLKLFGEIFDHDGGFGKEAAEEVELRATFQATWELWQAEYGEPYSEALGVRKCWHDCQGRCWHACQNNV